MISTSLKKKKSHMVVKRVKAYQLERDDEDGAFGGEKNVSFGKGFRRLGAKRGLVKEN